MAARDGRRGPRGGVRARRKRGGPRQKPAAGCRPRPRGRRGHVCRSVSFRLLPGFIHPVLCHLHMGFSSGQERRSAGAGTGSEPPTARAASPEARTLFRYSSRPRPVSEITVRKTPDRSTTRAQAGPASRPRCRSLSDLERPFARDGQGVRAGPLVEEAVGRVARRPEGDRAVARLVAPVRHAAAHPVFLAQKVRHPQPVGAARASASRPAGSPAASCRVSFWPKVHSGWLSVMPVTEKKSITSRLNRDR